ncbi:MAG: hypothetical protein NC200_05490 [Candidatus Gastranaerophilales bacterium]|nr:hypothetical protein [Candidatus Gastranaerophilales bacterium]
MAISFRAGLSNQVTQPSETKANPKNSVSNVVLDDIGEDIVDIDSCDNEPIITEKKSGWQKFKDGYTSFRKGLVTIGQYAAGTLKGLVYGSAAACAVLGADGLRGIIKKSPNYISTTGKVLAGVVGAAILVGNLFNANLNANSKKAELDHRWKTGHNK